MDGRNAEFCGCGRIDVGGDAPICVAERPEGHLHQVAQRFERQRRFFDSGAKRKAIDLRERVGLMQIHGSDRPLDIVPVADGVVFHIDRTRRDVFQKFDGLCVQ